MYPALVHSELYIRFVLRFYVDYEHIVPTIISDLILMYDIAQSYNVGDGSLAKPNAFVVTHHFCLVGHYHGYTVALKLHTDSGLERLCDQCRVTKQIHRVLVVQEYDLPEVQLIVEILRLVEELCDVWLKFSVQLFELESPV